MMMARTEPRTLEAAFIAQAHSTRFPPVSSAGGTGSSHSAPARARSPVGNGMPMAKPNGTSSPALTSEFHDEGQAHQPLQQAGQHGDIEQQGGGNQQQGQPYPAACPASHHRETMLPAPLDSRSRNTTTVNA